MFKGFLVKLKAKIVKTERHKHVVQSLWIGENLSIIERLSICSFLRNGFEYHLYTYGDVANIPKGTVVKNANKIIKQKYIFTYSNGSPAAFSVLFRYALLYKKGGIWSDLDVVCIKPFVFNQPYVIAAEIEADYLTISASTFVLQSDPKSKAMKHAYNRSFELRDSVIKGEIQWGIGRVTLNEIITKFDLSKFQVSWQTFTTCNWGHIQSFLDPSYSEHAIPTRIENVPEETVAIHLWHEIFRRQGIEKDKKYSPDSLLEQLKSKYLSE